MMYIRLNKNIGKTADSEEAAGLQERRDKISQFPADYKQNPKEKLNPAQLEQYYYMQKLETDVAKWEKEKEKIKQCLWWDDTVKGLANQNQSTTDSGAISENESTPSTPTEQTEPEAPPPATLNPNGKAWFIHPITLINYFNIKIKLWHEPLKNSQRTYYNSSDNIKPSNGAFGKVRSFWNEETKSLQKKTHNGLDLFADINTPCYACLDGEIIQYKNEGSNGYGNVLVLKIKGDHLRDSINNYSLEYKDEVVSGNGFNLNADYFYLRYCHLSSAVLINGNVQAGDLIAYSGDSGNVKGVCNPHVHFEIAMKASGNGLGLVNRYNPAFFVNLQAIDEKLQTDVKKRRNNEKK